jgi:hypothetical protein
MRAPFLFTSKPSQGSNPPQGYTPATTKRVCKFKDSPAQNAKNKYACVFSRLLRVFNQPESPSAFFAYRMGWLQASSLGRSLRSLTRGFAALCAVVTLYKIWISNSRQKRAGKETPSLCSSTIQSKRKYAITHRCYGDESGVTGGLQRVREVICARPRFRRSVGADICKSSTNIQEANIEI